MNPIRLLLAAGLLLSFASPGAAAPRGSVPGAPHRMTRAVGVTNIDIDRRADINRLNMFVSNVGAFGYDMNGNYTGGLFYPNHTSKTAIYAAGLWIGARVAGTHRVTAAEYSQEYVPGRIVAGVSEPDDPRLVVYKVLPWKGVPADSAHVDDPGASFALGEDPLVHHSWSEYVSGAKPFGAPTRIYRLDNTATPAPGDSVNVEGPDVVGDQMTWCVYNDADPFSHYNEAGSTQPLGVEVKQRVYGYDQPGTLGNVTFLRYDITNKGGSTLDSTYVSVWSDPDLGQFTDDLTGCDPARSLGYAYNGGDKDATYGTTPPSLGVLVLRGPVRALGDTLPMTAFTSYINGTDPLSAEASYAYLRGLNQDLSVIVDPTTSLPTTYMYSGDPVLATGWRDVLPSDRRMSVSMGPFSMAPGQSQTVVVAIIAIQCGSRLQAISELRFEADFVRNFYRGTIPSGGMPDLVPSVVAPPAEVRQGCVPFDASYCIHNEGTASSGAFTSNLTMLRLADSQVLATAAVSSLRPGESLAQILPLTIDDSRFAPTGVLHMFVDDPSQVIEANEFNNDGHKSLAVVTPSLRSIVDVRPDQGHQVRLTLAPSSRDIEGSTTPVLQYEIYRQVEAGAAAVAVATAERVSRARAAGMISDERALLAGWDYVSSVPAHGESEYGTIVPTLEDSSASGPHPAHFMVRAATAVPTTYFDSCSEPGVSVDDLAPSTPADFRITGIEPGPRILLAWSASPEPDVQSYALHRGAAPGFIPGPSNRIATVSGRSYADPAAPPGGSTLYYKLAAADIAGNHSAYALATASVTAVDGGRELPRAYSFSTGEPNPARQRTTFRFELPMAVPVTLRVFDVSGRVVREAHRAVPFEAGRFEWAWDGRDDHSARLGAGLYFVRLETPRFRRTVRAILLGGAP